MSLLVNLCNESTKAKPVNVEVVAYRGESTITLTITPNVEGCDYYYILDPEDARALAAALLHYADEAGR